MSTVSPWAAERRLDAVDLGQVLRMGISSKFPGDADADPVVAPWAPAQRLSSAACPV